MNFDAFEKKAKELGVLGIVVTKDGKEIGKKLWDEQCRRNVYSASKSFTSTAVGIAVKEGLLSLDEKLVDCFAEDLPETVSDNLAKATVKDLLTMCLGQEKAELMGAQRPVYEEEDWVKMSLAFPFVYEPGTKFVYNNVGPYLAGVLVERRAGCDQIRLQCLSGEESHDNRRMSGLSGTSMRGGLSEEGCSYGRWKIAY